MAQGKPCWKYPRRHVAPFLITPSPAPPTEGGAVVLGKHRFNELKASLAGYARHRRPVPHEQPGIRPSARALCIGRPNVFQPCNLQDFNRYSYVHNNPLSATDPSGFEVTGLIGGIELIGGINGQDAIGDWKNTNYSYISNIGLSNLNNSFTLGAVNSNGGIGLPLVSTTPRPNVTISNQHSTNPGREVDPPSVGAMGVSLGLDVTPFVGSGKSLTQLFTGRDLVTGEHVNR